MIQKKIECKIRLKYATQDVVHESYLNPSKKLSSTFYSIIVFLEHETILLMNVNDMGRKNSQKEQ